MNGLSLQTFIKVVVSDVAYNPQLHKNWDVNEKSAMIGDFINLYFFSQQNIVNKFVV